MLEDSVLETGKFKLHDIDSPRSVPDFDHAPNARPSSPHVTARAPSRPQSPAAEQPERPTQPVEGQPTTTSKKARNAVRSRRPMIYAIGALLLAAALGGGYVYMDNAAHFQSTDDAFIAARQSSLAPKVSGYIAAVPVNAHQPCP